MGSLELVNKCKLASLTNFLKLPFRALALRQRQYIDSALLPLQPTGSAKITTSTVAFPGVSKLTSGVSIVWPSFFTKDSISGNCLLGHEKAMRPNAVAWSTGCPRWISSSLHLSESYPNNAVVSVFSYSVIPNKFCQYSKDLARSETPRETFFTGSVDEKIEKDL